MWLFIALVGCDSFGGHSPCHSLSCAGQCNNANRFFTTRARGYGSFVLFCPQYIAAENCAYPRSMSCRSTVASPSGGVSSTRRSTACSSMEFDNASIKPCIKPCMSYTRVTLKRAPALHVLAAQARGSESRGGGLEPEDGAARGGGVQTRPASGGWVPHAARAARAAARRATRARSAAQ